MRNELISDLDRTGIPPTIMAWILSLFLLVTSLPASAVEVGKAADGSYLVPTRQLIHPAGESLEYNGRPIDMVLSPDGKVLYVKDNRGLVVVDAASWKIISESKFPSGGTSMHGITITKDGSRVYATGAKGDLWEGKVGPDHAITYDRSVSLPGLGDKRDASSFPCGLALSSDEKTAYVCLSKNNTLAVVDLESAKLVREIPVGIAPFDVVLAGDNKLYVSNWGGRRPNEHERTGLSAGSKVLVDARGVGSSGTISVVDVKEGKETAQIETGLHPSDLELSRDGKTLYVANANSDTVSVIDTAADKVSETILVRPDPTLPFGSAPNALAASDDGKTLFVANGGNNAVAVISLKKPKSVISGYIPAAWYPGAVATDGKYVYIANVKGYGTRFKDPEQKGWGIRQFLGTIGRVQIPSSDTLKSYTAQVRSDGRIPQALKAIERSSSDKKPVPVPANLGEPSVFEHVVYIIKENKTYDQVFGDIGKGNSDPSLCVFGRQSSPNHHALAEQFVLLDNYYCNGVCSADGHAWTTQGNASDYLEKSFGGWSRSYPFGGDDSLAICSSGMIWDDVLASGLSYRNYGEMNLTHLPGSTSWADVYKDYLDNTRSVKFDHNINIDRLKQYSCPDYPGWNLKIPDVLRANIFLGEFKEAEKSGNWPDFLTIYLPVDHTTGGSQGMPTPSAQVADNDLALGRIVEAISKSRFWPKTVIFVIEDDPQSGFDHVDGHRSLCLVISPYTRRGEVVSEFYNQTAVLHTMEQILGIPPMNQMDALAPLMIECFTSTADLKPYTCLPNQVALDEMPAKTGQNFGDGRVFVRAGDTEDPFRLPDNIEDDKLNRAIWSMAKGPEVPYPASLAGAHGRGLKALHLQLNGENEDDD